MSIRICLGEISVIGALSAGRGVRLGAPQSPVIASCRGARIRLDRRRASLRRAWTRLLRILERLGVTLPVLIVLLLTAAGGLTVFAAAPTRHAGSDEPAAAAPPARTAAALEGIVRDSAGGVVPGVSVSLTGSETGLRRITLTDDEGRFSFPNQTAGAYELRAELEGFRPVVMGGIRLKAGDRVRQDLVLRPLEINEIQGGPTIAGGRVWYAN
jgi:hypothetical protein